VFDYRQEEDIFLFHIISRLALDPEGGGQAFPSRVKLFSQLHPVAKLIIQ
jgi:hypothetical protein